jgi:hypothetical protein
MPRLKLSPINWSLIKQVNLSKNKNPKINSWRLLTTTPVCLCYLTNPVAKSHWWLGGSVKASFYSEAFVNRKIIAFKQWKLKLNTAELLDFREYQANSYVLEFDFPYWHKQIKIQVWRYKFDLKDAIHTDTQQILSELNLINQKVTDISDFNN